jgi:hypothetical protein
MKTMDENFTPPKDSRLKLYKQALKKLEKSDKYLGICYFLALAFEEKYPKRSFYFMNIPVHFPEFWNKRPSHIKNPYKSWFKDNKVGMNMRVRLLETVIKEMEDGL